MAVDYTPTLGDYKELKPFRYWCQKVLPLVYDDSLSYYELLCKVVDYLNKTMEDVETLHDDVDDLHDAYVQLQNYVNDYFDNLDVQEEIDNKLDAMAEDGTLSTILLPLMQNVMSPVFVSSTSAMTDTSRVYVLLPDGYMYYYTGGAWTNSGFVYGVTSDSFRYRDTITDDLANHTDAGFYTISKTDSMTDLPTGYSGAVGCLIVYNPGPTSAYAFQMLKSGGADLYFRLVTIATHSGGSWSRVVRSEEPTRFYYRGIISDNLSNHTDPGFYVISNNSSVTDLPSDYNSANGCLVVYTPGANTAYCVQILRDAGSSFYHRLVHISNHTPTNWLKMANTGDLSQYIAKAGTSVTGALSNCKTSGIYLGSKANVNDAPSLSTRGAFTLLAVPAPTPNFTLQYYIDGNGSIFKRFIQNSDGAEIYDGWHIVIYLRCDYISPLTGKKWYACGDSFTHGDFGSLNPTPTIGKGFYANQYPVYPYFIGNRTGAIINLNFAQNGATLAERTDGSTGYVFADHYTDIPLDADYVTLYFGINDNARCDIGTVNDTTTDTFCGAMYTVLNWLAVNRPNTKVGVIASNAVAIRTNQAAINMAKKMGVPCLDMNSTDHMLVLDSRNPDVSDGAKAVANAKYKVSDTNGHPNALCHELESYFIEQWLLSL